MVCEKLSNADFLETAARETVEAEYLDSVWEAPEDDLTTDRGMRRHRAKMRRRDELNSLLPHYYVEVHRRGLSDEFRAALRDERTAHEARLG